jgi:lipoprotein-releasing system permease protein
VHWITRVSITGISIITAALVILIAAFNGIESMVERLYSDFDAPITIRSSIGKTFLEEDLPVKKIKLFHGVKSVSRAVEETVILNSRQKFQNGTLLGVDAEYLKTCKLGSKEHLVDGYDYLSENGQETAVVGATLLDNLEESISGLEGKAFIKLYTPLRDASISRRKSPFQISPLVVVGRMNYNAEVNRSVVLTSLDFAREQLNYNSDVTAYYLDLNRGTDPVAVRDNIQQSIGKNYVVKTAAQKNELIYKTSRTEKKIVILILGFIFVLAGFNLIASLNMLYIEKKENIETMFRFGASKRLLFDVFFKEGLIIAGIGIVIGLSLGIVICLLQMQFGLFKMPNATQMPFPIKFRISDVFLILVLVSILSTLCSFFPVYYLIYGKRKNS